MEGRKDEKKNIFAIDNVAVRLVKEAPIIGGTPLNTPGAVVKRFAETLCEYDREVVAIVNLKADMTPINVHIASMGSVNEAMFSVREIMKAAILSNSSNIILMHNHPSGSLKPSSQDVMATDKMNRACDIMGIKLMDHIIVGGENEAYFSFKEKGMISMDNINYEMNYLALDIIKVAEI